MADPVTAAWVSGPDTVSVSFFRSFTALLGYDLAHHRRVWRGEPIDIRLPTDGLVAARNHAVHTFLTARDAPWLWWVDTDMGFAPDTVDRLVDAADPLERPVVGGLCFASIDDTADGAGGWSTTTTPTVYDWASDPQQRRGFAVRWDYPPDTLTACVGTGSACVLIHRSVLERIRDAYGPCWYNRLRNPSMGELVGEDLSFCVRLAALGVPLHVHTGITTTHHKSVWLGEPQYRQQQLVRSANGREDRAG